MRQERVESRFSRLTIVLLSFCGLVFATPIHGQFSPYLLGSVGISARPAARTGGPDVDSAGEVTAHKWNGDFDYARSIGGFHTIHESGSQGEPTVAQEEIEVAGQYYGYVRTTAEAGTCYRASLMALSPGVQEISRGSSEQCFPPDYTSPILMDLDGDDFRLVGVDDGVRFDLDADGVPESLGWTTAETLDGFLCRDLDRNGWIDDGSELFGTSTLLASGVTANHGYEALAELDDPAHGGDGDGRITASDGVFEDLCVWFDSDHDGLSDEGETFSLDSLGVLEIETAYRESWRRDRVGNLFRYRSSGRVEAIGTPRRFATYDVFFVVEDDTSESTEP